MCISTMTFTIANLLFMYDCSFYYNLLLISYFQRIKKETNDNRDRTDNPCPVIPEHIATIHDYDSNSMKPFQLVEFQEFHN